MKLYEKILDIAKRRGIIYPSNEIYGGVSGFYDYGPVGTRIKRNIEDIIRKSYIIDENCYEVECPTLSIEEVWKASGHVQNFTDFITECENCKEPYRADHLIEGKLKISTDGMNKEQLNDIIRKNNIKCEKCGGNLNDVYNFNLMFETEIAPGKNKKKGYLRPETAQTTFISFKRLWEIARKKLPFGVLQIGHSYRNEISPRQYMIRLREFTQAEIEFFIDPEDKKNYEIYNIENLKNNDYVVKIVDKNERISNLSIKEAVSKKIIENPIIGYFLQKSINLFEDIGIDKRRLQVRQHKDTERAFYSRDTWDIEFLSEIGRIELVGIADRGDYDLKQHQIFSRESMEINFNGRKFIPNVIEVAYGIDRPIYCILESCYVEEIKTGDDRGKGNERTYFKFPKEISPYVGVFPLMNKDNLPEKAKEVVKILKRNGIYSFYDDAGSIGRRYSRMDEIGVYYCITIDYETLNDNTVTIRERDSRKQIRIKIDELEKFFK